MDPERAKEVHDRSLPGEEHKSSRFCSMCGAKFCAMRLSQRALRMRS
jgi:phosphomethylpyrimidine synthase